MEGKEKKKKKKRKEKKREREREREGPELVVSGRPGRFICRNQEFDGAR